MPAGETQVAEDTRERSKSREAMEKNNFNAVYPSVTYFADGAQPGLNKYVPAMSLVSPREESDKSHYEAALESMKVAAKCFAESRFRDTFKPGENTPTDDQMKIYAEKVAAATTEGKPQPFSWWYHYDKEKELHKDVGALSPRTEKKATTVEFEKVVAEIRTAMAEFKTVFDREVYDDELNGMFNGLQSSGDGDPKIQTYTL